MCNLISVLAFLHHFPTSPMFCIFLFCILSFCFLPRLSPSLFCLRFLPKDFKPAVNAERCQGQDDHTEEVRLSGLCGYFRLAAIPRPSTGPRSQLHRGLERLVDVILKKYYTTKKGICQPKQYCRVFFFNLGKQGVIHFKRTGRDFLKDWWGHVLAERWPTTKGQGGGCASCKNFFFQKFICDFLLHTFPVSAFFFMTDFLGDLPNHPEPEAAYGIFSHFAKMRKKCDGRDEA